MLIQLFSRKTGNCYSSSAAAKAFSVFSGLFLVVGLIESSHVLAATKPQREKLRERFAVKNTLENQISATYLASTSDFSELTNGAIQPPYAIVANEWKASLRLEAGTFTLIARPHLTLKHERAKPVAGKAIISNRIVAKWSELYGTIQPSSSVALSAGKQNFQWGNGELFNASNPIFGVDLNGRALYKSSLSEPDARDLIRINYSWDQNLSLVLMAAYRQEMSRGDNEDVSYGSGSTGSDQKINGVKSKENDNLPAAIKLEYTGSSGADYLGLVVGAAEQGDKLFFGTYSGLNFSDSTLFFFDAGWNPNQNGLYPEAPLPGAQVIPRFSKRGSQSSADSTQSSSPVPQSSSQDSKKQTYESIAEIGARYTFVSGHEIKVEWIGNQTGYTLTEMDAAEKLIEDSPGLIPYFYLGSNIPFLWRHAALLALHFPNLGANSNLTGTIRFLKPLEDNSGSVFAYSEYDINDSSSAFLAFSTFVGSKLSRAGDIYRSLATLGCRFNW